MPAKGLPQIHHEEWEFYPTTDSQYKEEFTATIVSHYLNHQAKYDSYTLMKKTTIKLSPPSSSGEIFKETLRFGNS